MTVKTFFEVRSGTRGNRRRYARMAELINRSDDVLENGTEKELWQLNKDWMNSEATGDEKRTLCEYISNQIDRVTSKTLFTIYWRNGTKSIIAGETVDVAYNNSGRNAEAIKAIDFYMQGDNRDYVWNKEYHRWDRKPEMLLVHGKSAVQYNKIVKPKHGKDFDGDVVLVR